MQKGSEPPIETPRPFVVLVPEAEWWTVVHASPGGDAELYVDIAAPATWETSDLVTIVDLDLDVVRWSDGRVELVDEDEFLEHQTSRGYPAWMIDRARAAAARAVLAAESRVEPFGLAGKVWLERIS
jgi:protein associated with RNAse G/E